MLCSVPYGSGISYTYLAADKILSTLQAPWIFFRFGNAQQEQCIIFTDMSNCSDIFIRWLTDVFIMIILRRLKTPWWIKRSPKAGYSYHFHLIKRHILSVFLQAKLVYRLFISIRRWNKWSHGALTHAFPVFPMCKLTHNVIKYKSEKWVFTINCLHIGPSPHGITHFYGLPFWSLRFDILVTHMDFYTRMWQYSDERVGNATLSEPCSLCQWLIHLLVNELINNRVSYRMGLNVW